MSKEFDEPKAQTETWALKDAAWQEVAHLPLAEALRERSRIANETVLRLGMARMIRDPRARKPSEGTDKAA